MKTTTQRLLEEHALSFRRPVHWNISTGPPDRQFNAADRANLTALCEVPRTQARAAEEIILPQQRRWQYKPLRCWLAAFFVVAGPPLAASQPTPQSTSKMVGTGAVGPTEQGWSVALSADGKTAIVGGIVDNRLSGAAWVYTRGGDVWTQQGNKLVGANEVGQAGQGFSVALSADGNTAIVGGPYDNFNVGAAWVYTRRGDVWAQQGSKLVGIGAVGSAAQGTSVALSADGNTVIVGGSYDNRSAGAAWVYTRSGDFWTQQGSKLVGTGAAGIASQGTSVALSADGNTAIVGGPYDNFNVGAAWVYTRRGDVWTQQGNKLVGANKVGQAGQGFSVALSGDGDTAIVGGPHDNSNTGAAWVYTRNDDFWTQQGSKLVGIGAVGDARQGHSVALSSDGNTAIVGGPHDNSRSGASWVHIRSGTVWKQQGSKLVGADAVGHAEQGFSVALSADGSTAVAGALADNRVTGAAWVHTRSNGVWTPIAAPSPGF
jgi:antibiotic biosynthesis monooxygenase (ABM) superfamily enzyme